MQSQGLKAILFGIQLVLIGGLLMFGLAPVLLFFESRLVGGPGTTLVYIGPLLGLVVALIGGMIGFRGYTRDD